MTFIEWSWPSVFQCIRIYIGRAPHAAMPPGSPDSTFPLRCNNNPACNSYMNKWTGNLYAGMSSSIPEINHCGLVGTVLIITMGKWKRKKRNANSKLMQYSTACLKFRARLPFYKEKTSFPPSYIHNLYKGRRYLERQLDMSVRSSIYLYRSTGSQALHRNCADCEHGGY